MIAPELWNVRCTMKPNDRMIKTQQIDKKKTTESTTTILALPADVIRLIAGLLSIKDLINFGKSTKRFYNIVFNKDVVIKVLQQQQIHTALIEAIQTGSNNNVDVTPGNNNNGQLLGDNNNVAAGVDNTRSASKTTDWQDLVKMHIADESPRTHLQIIELTAAAVDADEQQNKWVQCFNNNYVDCTNFLNPHSCYSVCRIIAFAIIFLAICFFLVFVKLIAGADRGKNFATAAVFLVESICLLALSAIILYPKFQATQVNNASIQWKREFDGRISSLSRAVGLFKEQPQEANGDIENANAIAHIPNHDPDADENTGLIAPINWY